MQPAYPALLRGLSRYPAGLRGLAGRGFSLAFPLIGAKPVNRSLPGQGSVSSLQSPDESTDFANASKCVAKVERFARNDLPCIVQLE